MRSIITLIVLSLLVSACTGQVRVKSAEGTIENPASTPQRAYNQPSTFPQIHTNLKGMVREFVRKMYQDKKGNYWFGTNGSGLIRYDGTTLEKINIEGISPFMAVRQIVEDAAGNIWFGSSEGLIQYDGEKFVTFAEKDASQYHEIWGLTIDKSGRMWVGSVGGVRNFDGEKFTPFLLPKTKVDHPNPMLSDNLVFEFLEDKHGTMWFVTDGNGIFILRFSVTLPCMKS